MTPGTRGAVEMTVAMSIAGTIGWFVIISGQPVQDVVFWRCVFGAAALLFVCAAKGHLKWNALSRTQLLFAATGGFAIVANWLCLFAAYPRASISVATVIYNTQPFMLAILGALFAHEKIAASNIAWLCVAFIGTLMLAQTGQGNGAAGTDYLIGILLALGAAFFYAVAAIMAKKLVGAPPHLIALIHTMIGIVALAPFVNLTDLPTHADTWAVLVTLGVLHTGVVFTLLYGALQKLPTTVAGSLSFIYPIVAILVDVLAFDHRLQLSQMAGIAAILFAAAAITLRWPSFRNALEFIKARFHARQARNETS